MSLGEFLKGAATDRSPWNCSTLAADWCLALGHPDFAAEWRGTVDEAECEEAACGDLVALWDEGIGAALPAVAPDMVEPGDILVVALGGRQAGAIWTGQRLAMRAARGLHFVDPGSVEPVKAWRP